MATIQSKTKREFIIKAVFSANNLLIERGLKILLSLVSIEELIKYCNNNCEIITRMK